MWRTVGDIALQNAKEKSKKTARPLSTEEVAHACATSSRKKSLMANLLLSCVWITANIIALSLAQLTPSGDVFVCPGTVVEITCNVSTGFLQWGVQSPQIHPKQSLGISYDFFDYSRLGIPRPYAGNSAPGVTETTHALSASGVSSSLTVNTTYHNLTAGPIVVTCASASTASITLAGIAIM